ncbi:protease SohB [Marinimicrobium sp. C6131]|uniref:protease SohB n=1 Tax=Marinimicrobium sp. C6131 TaxID=3022676 RepID=UPI00223CADFE|nr:protease SohB [Marinimicrobium sp. C6131]UZJ45469.1 protease SohB [Marinimicrobium sp. C6131]
MEFINEYGLFLAKVVTVVIAIGFVVGLVATAGSKNRKKADKGHVEVVKLNDRFKHMTHALKQVALDEATRKADAKAEKKREKAEQTKKKKALKTGAKSDEKPADSDTKRVFVLDFNGDIKASATDSLREEITAVLSLARPADEVVVKLESGGGLVHSYGLAASQLARIRDRHIPLTVCVDKVAASGGYMMACVADRILAAPFAVLGSIGVVAQLPNFHKLLKKNNIDFEMFTAGEYKRTVTMFGENTKKGRDKFVEDLEDTHVLFKEFVSEHRPQVEIDKVATGEIWFGRRAQSVKLIDELKTSDEYLVQLAEKSDVFEVSFVHKKSLPEKLGMATEGAVDRLLLRWWQRSNNQRWF